jgi:hypothetical protein
LSRKFFFMFKERDEKYVEILFDNNITIWRENENMTKSYVN